MTKTIKLSVSEETSNLIRTMLTKYNELNWEITEHLKEEVQKRLVNTRGYIELINLNSKVYGEYIIAVKDDWYDDQDFDPGHYEFRYVYTYFLYIDKNKRLRARAFYTLRKYRDLYSAEVDRYPIDEKRIFNLAEEELESDGYDQSIDEKEEDDYECNSDYRKYLGCED